MYGQFLGKVSVRLDSNVEKFLRQFSVTAHVQFHVDSRVVLSTFVPRSESIRVCIMILPWRVHGASGSRE